MDIQYNNSNDIQYNNSNDVHNNNSNDIHNNNSNDVHNNNSNDIHNNNSNDVHNNNSNDVHNNNSNDVQNNNTNDVQNNNHNNIQNNNQKYIKDNIQNTYKKDNKTSSNKRQYVDIEEVENIINKKLRILDEIPQILKKRSMNNNEETSNNNKNHKKIKTNKEIMNITKNKPTTFKEAINSPDKLMWIKAINNELDNLYNNKIMTFVRHIPKNTNLISTKWIFTNKTDENNNIIKHKARLVARGFKQIEGKDFNITYSPTLNSESIRIILSIASKMKWKVFQLDIKAAYLNADLDKTLYVNIPEGDKNYKKGFWKLNKALYGLRQAGRQWFLTISNFLIKNGFQQLSSEQCIFKKVKNNKLITLIGLYVDDMLICGSTSETNKIINKIKGRFKISNCEPIKYMLGIKIEKQNNYFLLSQQHLINSLLEQYNITNIKKTRTPCVGDNTISENKTPFDQSTYKSAIGSLLYIAKTTRPDISFSVNKAARKCERPTKSDWNKVLNIFKYLNSTKEYKLKLDGQGTLNAYTDSDFAGDIEDRKSTSGYLILIGESPICWGSKKQSIVATSTTEAEYVATSECIKKVLWIRNIFKELFNFNKPITVYTDNLSSLKTIENGELNSKLKHISIKYHFNRDNILYNRIKLKYIESKKMLADTLTKNINGTQMSQFTDKILFKP